MVTRLPIGNAAAFSRFLSRNPLVTSNGRYFREVCNASSESRAIRRKPLLSPRTGSGTRNDRSYRKCAGADGWGADGCSGRCTFDKTVSSKPLAFAADAATMGIEWHFGTRGTGWSAPSKRMDRPFEKGIVGGAAGHWELRRAMQWNEASTDTRVA